MDSCLYYDTALVLAAVTGNKSLIQLAEKREVNCKKILFKIFKANMGKMKNLNLERA